MPSLKSKTIERGWAIMDRKSRALQMQQCTKEAEALLQKIRLAADEKYTEEIIIRLLQQCVCLKYGIEEQEETDFIRLGIISLKTADSGGTLDENALRSLVNKKDCHRFPVVLQMKTSFILFVERTLGLTFDDDSAVAVKTVEDLASLVLRSMA